MNGVISLCHFCEQHGYRVVFTCQPFVDDEEALPPSSSNCDAPELVKADSNWSICCDRRPMGSPDSGNSDSMSYSVGRSRIRPFYGHYDLLMNRVAPQRNDVSTDGSLAAPLNGTNNASGVDEEIGKCVACSPFEGWRPVYLTNDHSSRISFVGSQYPYVPEVFDMVNFACLRSLNIEIPSMLCKLILCSFYYSRNEHVMFALN